MSRCCHSNPWLSLDSWLPPPSQDNGHLCTTAPPPDRTSLLVRLSVCLPETVHVLCSNSRAPFRPVEYMRCVFLSFSLCASLRPPYSQPHNKPCSCFPSARGRRGCCRKWESSLVVLVGLAKTLFKGSHVVHPHVLVCVSNFMVWDGAITSPAFDGFKKEIYCRHGGQWSEVCLSESCV